MNFDNFEDDDDAVCGEHYKQKQMYCKCCQIVVCPDCWTENHGDHEIEPYKNVKEKRLSDVKPQLEACITSCKHLSDLWMDLKENFSNRAADIKIDQLDELVRNASKQKFEKELDLLFSKLEKQKNSFDKAIEIVEKLAAEMKHINEEIFHTMTLLKKDDEKFQQQLASKSEVSDLTTCSIDGLNVANYRFRFHEIPNLICVGMDPTHITEAFVDSTGTIFCRAEQRIYADAKAPLIKLTRNLDELRVQLIRDWHVEPVGFCRLRNVRHILYNIAVSNQFLYGLFRYPRQKRYAIQVLDKESLRFRRPLTVDLLRLEMTNLWSIAGKSFQCFQ